MSGRWLPVYPRWRGEHDEIRRNGIAPGGLSPLARGTRKNLHRKLGLTRFIPAGAGNTYALNRVLRGFPVYPRWRGEHLLLGCCWISAAGLSPLARGTHSQHALQPDSWRFIPAGAGNTRMSALTINGKRGLSPLARGTPLSRFPHCFAARFIPAGAGNTNKDQLIEIGTAVYPRWRGEHPKSQGRDGHSRGLSPLARGTRMS